ncbi:MAG: hypothetical protein Tsb0014_12480 [Pleurocapsa sp.]
MKIVDLSYFENVSEKELIFGGTSGTIGAYASASGEDTFALTDVDLELKTKKNGKSKLTGEATALAVGEDAIADTYYHLDGFTKVKVKIVHQEGEDFAYENLRIKAKS